MKRNLLLAAAAAGTLAPLVAGRRGFLAWPPAHALVLVPTLLRNNACFGPIATHFETPRREVWLTIDDGPDPRDTPAMLEALAKYRAKATFFMIGRKAGRLRSLAWEVRSAGHGIGNHTYSHPSATFWALGPHAMQREIERGASAIHAATGVRPALFRSPVGMTNPFVHPALGDQRLIGWSASGLDGLRDRGRVVVDRILARVRPGAIVVIHEGGAPGRVGTLQMLLERLTAEGYACVIPDFASLR